MTDFNADIDAEALFPVVESIQSRAHVSSMERYREMYRQSIEEPEVFWGEMARSFYWKQDFTEVGPKFNFDKSQGPVSIEMFKDGKTSLCYNCLDRHLEAGKGSRTAFYYECNDVDDSHLTFTYQQVFDMVCQLSNALKASGVQKGDRVTVYLPMMVHLPVTMLACSRIGAIHSVVFGGFSADSLADRIIAAQSKVIVTADGVMRGAKPIQLKAIGDKAIEKAAAEGFAVEKQVCVARLAGTKFADQAKHGWQEGRDVWYSDYVSSHPTTCTVEWMDAEDPLFMLYTSGSTGKPKGVVHTTGGYMVGAYATMKYSFDYHPEDTFFCTADCGWITGHTYITYGPLLNCASQVLFEGVPTHPGPDRFWAICSKYKVDSFYTAPTAIRALMKSGEAPVKKHDLGSLKLLGSVGEPINPEAWKWYHRVVGGGRCPIADTYWQTETGSHLITPLCGAQPLKPGSGNLPFFGVEPVILADREEGAKAGKELSGACSGQLCLKRPNVSMMRTVFGDHGRFEETYFSQHEGYYFTGDGCKRDKDGYYWLTGRIDDVINVSGHRIGTAEVESALVAHAKVAEAAVVGYPHEIKGEGIWCYVTLNEGEEYTDALIPELKTKVREVIGAFAMPDQIHWAPGLPKTRSGKIMRRVLRKLALPEYETVDLGDTSTLADPSVVDQLKARHPRAKSAAKPAASKTATDFNADIDQTEVFPVVESIQSRAHVSSMERYREMYRQSIEEPAVFWGEMARSFYWKQDFTEVGPKFNFDKSQGPVSIEMFKGGKTSLCYNCLDRHLEVGKGSRTAFYYECNDMDDSHLTFTYQQVFDMVCQLSNALKASGVKKGDRVTVYLPMMVHLPVTMLACSRIGAIHSVVFGGFSADSLADRIIAAQSKVIVTADGVMRGAKPIQLKAIGDKAIEKAAAEGFVVEKQVCVARLAGTKWADQAKHGWQEGRDVWYNDYVSSHPTTCDVEWMDAEDPLFMLYTSGSTGKPKGVVHTTGGYMVGAYATMKYSFDYHPEDTFFCTADCGWITGHTYITYGPLLNCASQVLFEGVPTHPGPDRFWAICSKYKVDSFYTAPTAIRALMKSGEEPVKKHDLSSLKLLGSVGEPINPEAWKWYHRVVGGGRCPIADTYWQTETGGHLITPLCGAQPLKPGSGNLPFFGVEPVILADREEGAKAGKELSGECSGQLCLKRPNVSMMRTVFGDHKRFEETYFSQHEGYYFTGDGCKRDKDGYYWLTGRIDDVINVSGHRIGTAEVESALVAHAKVAEAAVVGYPHEIKGEGIWCYVTLNEGEEYTDALIPELKTKVREVIGAFAMPDQIHWAPGLPKTRSGKIMRRVLRKLALPDYQTVDLGDTSTLADPSVVDQLKARHPRAAAAFAPPSRT